METKVKGDKIKEGSIPLSALAEDVKGEFDGKYGFKNYVGKLADDNPKIETNYGRIIIYIKNKNLVYDSSDVDEIILNNGPKVVIKLTKLGYKTIIEIVENASSVGYYGPIYLYEEYNEPPTLGVDPIQLKYLTNPIVLGHRSTIPEDLYDYNNDDFKFSVKEYNTIYPFIKIKHNNQICDIVWGERPVGDEMWVIHCIAKNIGVYDSGSEIKPSQYRVRCENGVIKISNKLNSEIL